ncbi:MAG: hypothetical protein WC610_00070 [Patescibacteria group bacterium]
MKFSVFVGLFFLAACAQTDNQFQTSASRFHSPAETLKYGDPAGRVDSGQVAMRYGGHLDETAGILSAATIKDPEARDLATEAIVKISRNRTGYGEGWNGYNWNGSSNNYGFQENKAPQVDFFRPPQSTEPAAKIFAAPTPTPAPKKTVATQPDPLSTPVPVAINPPVDKKKQFLISELARTIDILSQEPMTPPANTFPAMLDKNNLVSWFDLERPEPQGIYYRVLGLPIPNNALLNRTKSEFFQMSQEEREKLKIALQPILDKLRGKIAAKE